MNRQQMIVGKRYRLVRELGKTRSSTTYLARDLALPDRPHCIVQQFRLEVAAENLWQDIRLMCAKKASLWLKLASYSQIPQLLAYFEESDCIYLVQEYIEGTNLAHKLQRGNKIAEGQVIYWLHDLLSSLEIIHRNGIIHGDIKPSHIVIRDSDEKAFLVDFGIFKAIDARFVDEMTSTAFTTDNIYYPTQIVGEPTAKSDIHAVGAIAIQALTGNQPERFLRERTNEKLLWQAEVEVNPKLAKILDKTISLNPENGYISTAETIEDLQQLPLFAIASKTTALENNLREPQETKIPPPIDRTVKTKPHRKFQWKLSYILLPLAGIVLTLAGWELVIPTFRPLYYLDRGNNSLPEQPQIALKYFQEALYLKPQMTNAWIGRGDALFAIERSQAALVSYDKATRLEPDSPKAWQGRGEVLYRLQRFEAAKTAFDKALELEPNNAEILNRKGRALYKLERYQEALATQEAALKLQPNNATALSDRGLALIGLGQYQEALISFSRAQAVEPENPQLLQNKALALQLLNRPQEASRLYQEALLAYDRQIEENPNNIFAIIDKANVLNQLRQYQQALATYERALEINSDSTLASIGKGNTFFALREYDKALETFDHALKLQPESYLTWHNRGSLLRDGLKNLPEAIASYEKAVQINPRFYHAWRDLGFAYSQNRQHEQALESFERAVSINNNDYKSWVGKGIALSSLGRIDEAISAFDRAATIQPQDPFVWLNRGFALEKAQRYTEACDAYQQVKNINPSFAPANQAIARIGCRQS